MRNARASLPIISRKAGRSAKWSGCDCSEGAPRLLADFFRSHFHYSGTRPGRVPLRKPHRSSGDYDETSRFPFARLRASAYRGRGIFNLCGAGDNQHVGFPRTRESTPQHLPGFHCVGVDACRAAAVLDRTLRAVASVASCWLLLAGVSSGRILMLGGST